MILINKKSNNNNLRSTTHKTKISKCDEKRRKMAKFNYFGFCQLSVFARQLWSRRLKVIHDNRWCAHVHVFCDFHFLRREISILEIMAIGDAVSPCRHAHPHTNERIIHRFHRPAKNVLISSNIGSNRRTTTPPKTTHHHTKMKQFMHLNLFEFLWLFAVCLCHVAVP